MIAAKVFYDNYILSIRNYSFVISILSIFIITIAGFDNYSYIWLLVPIAITILREAIINYDMKSYGDSVLSCKDITPAQSLFEALEKQGVAASDIEEAYFMTYTLMDGCEYINKKVREQVVAIGKLHLYGFGLMQSKLCEEYSNIITHPIALKIAKHKNLIITNNNQYYLWYEPYHIVEEGEHIICDGADLIKLSDKAKNKLMVEFKNLDKLGEAA